MSKRGEPSTEFTMLNEDFPALPGTVAKSGWCYTISVTKSNNGDSDNNDNNDNNNDNIKGQHAPDAIRPCDAIFAN